MTRKLRNDLLTLLAIVMLLIVLIVFFFIPFPYSVTEVYFEQEPYTEVDTYYDDVKSIVNEPYSEDANFLLEEKEFMNDFGPWGCGKTNIYLMTNLENESLCFDYIRTLTFVNLELCETTNERICFDPNQAKELKLHVAYGYCSRSRMFCSDVEDQDRYRVIPKFVSIPRVVKFKTTEVEEVIEKNRTVVKFKSVEKKRHITKYATLMNQLLN